jgi:predicted ATPase
MVNKRIVLTGGPGAGKTVISQRLASARPDRFALVPEAATQVYHALRTRWDRLDVNGRRDVQRRIFHLQVAQEQRIGREHPDRILLLDRGTIDGAAYWPDGSDDYWRDLGTSAGEQLDRYDAVIWLETCAALGLYDGEESNAVRFEDAPAAVAAGKVLLHLWRDHPALRHVGAFESLDDKIAAVAEVIDGLIAPGRSASG